MADKSKPAVPFSSYVPKVAIVTGGAQGLGLAIAYRLADDGINIAINDIHSKEAQIDAAAQEIRKKGRRAIAVAGDVSSEADVISMIERTVNELGSLDIMVANAGIVAIKSVFETTLELFETIHAVNTRGVFLCLKHAAIQMVKQGRGGRLIAASSMAGKQGYSGNSAYSASKFAVRGMTQSMSKELSEYGITVNTYAPGAIRTNMLHENKVSEDVIKMITERLPHGNPEDVASLVSYLAKPESYFINGQSVTIDGGATHFD
ncbi:NAD-binding protein [Fomitiporia mediterranea MF3/22]|uniref:NAD-binding protein n=1 Tax=Fomitiporia mediterranea (strain MF3/22) TaxID=694068 RepID=UPI0004407427|nr:NAD-binding protein [Fomitiporia mediterranea MF3/22]EJD06801.1 NAD-binding protein [Fomitiporia mediterranea MF3/22]